MQTCGSALLVVLAICSSEALSAVVMARHASTSPSSSTASLASTSEDAAAVKPLRQKRSLAGLFSGDSDSVFGRTFRSPGAVPQADLSHYFVAFIATSPAPYRRQTRTRTGGPILLGKREIDDEDEGGVEPAKRYERTGGAILLGKRAHPQLMRMHLQRTQTDRTGGRILLGKRGGPDTNSIFERTGGAIMLG